MRDRWTTRCCSAGALIVASSIAFGAQSDRQRTSLFPVQTAWTIDLGPVLAVPPALDEAHAYFATDEGRLVAHELARGRRVWSVEARTRSGSAANGGLVFSVEAERLVARRSMDGGMAWQVPFTDPIASPPAAEDGRLALVTPDALVMFRETDGQRLWSRELTSPANSRLALAAESVYAPTHDGRVMALRVDNGETIWERRLGGPATGMVAAGTRLYVGSTDNFLYCLSTRDGRVEWRWRTGADVVGVPIVDDASVYFVSLDNVLRALSRTSGVQRWFRPLLMRPTGGPILAGTTLLVPGLAKTVPAFDAATGAFAGDLPAGSGETAPLLFPVSGGPAEPPGVLIVTRDIEKGVAATLVTRQR